MQKIRDDASVLQAKLVSLDKRLEALEEYAKANRKSILGMEIGANYKNPQNVVPIGDGNVLSEMTGKVDNANAQDSDNIQNTGAVVPKTEGVQHAPKRRLFWPFG